MKAQLIVFACAALAMMIFAPRLLKGVRDARIIGIRLPVFARLCAGWVLVFSVVMLVINW